MAGGFRSPFFPLGLSSAAAPGVSPETGATAINVPTSWRQLGLAVVYSDSLCMANRNSAIGTLSEKVVSYTHEVRAIGGFYSCSITFKDNLSQIRDWLQDGVGRHIEVYDQSGTVIWEGFVDRVNATIENVQISRGPLISADVANRVKIRYSVADYTIAPPSVGVTLTSAPVNDTASQDKYGIIEKVLGLDQATERLANQIRNSWLREHAYPQSSITSSYASNSEPSIVLECLGYWHYLNTWIYFSNSTLETDLSTKLQAVLASSLNTTLFSTDYSFIETNTTQVRNSETDDRTAMTIISEMSTLSDSSNRKYNAGLLDGRVFYYQSVPELVAYYQETGGVIRDSMKSQVLPWNVRPGNWIYYSGLLSDTGSLLTLDDLYKNPVTAFIESVTFSSPFEVSITTQRLSKLDSLFARMGITGV